MTDDVRKLLGGFATGTLSEAERRTLFEAALEDDQLFAALADEQALKELLEDSTVRATLLRATEEPRFSFTTAVREWFEAPKSKALVATGVVVLALIAFKELRTVPEQHPQVAEVRAPVTAIERAPEASAPSPVERPARRSAPKKEALIASRDQKAEADQPRPMPAPPAPPPPAAKPASTQSEPLAAGGVVGGVISGPEIRASSRQMSLADQAAKAVSSPAPPAIPLGWELLRRDGDGEFRPVARDHQFTAGDIVRIRIRSARTGSVALSVPGQQTVAGSVQANEAASVPATGGIVIASDTNKIVLGFASAAGEAMNRFAEREEAKAKQAAAPQSMTIEIPIRQRAP